MRCGLSAQRALRHAPAAGLAHVDFRLLGPLEALVEGEPVPLGAPKQRALLAQFLLRPNEAIPVERLVDALWPEQPPASARHAVQVYVSRLRRALGPDRIEARSRAYVLRADRDEIDLGRFRGLVADARAALADGDPAGASARVSSALGFWRGRALDDLDGEPGVEELVLELQEERLAAVELRVESELQAGGHAELVQELERLVVEHPAREQLHGQLMLALHRGGRTDDALAAYEQARQALLNELGLEPSPRLRELKAAIRRDDPSLRPDPPELRARLHLPAQVNQFIGRETDVDEVVDLISRRGARLVTLTGTGGIGKTRLALAAAERLAGDFEDGVWFVDLSVVSEPPLVVPHVAQTLGVTEAADEPVEQALEAFAADRRMLLVTDNFEQVGEAPPELGRLLRSAPRLAVLATSRSPLRLPEEHEHDVPPLAVPEAVRLLVARARAVAGRFELTEANSGEIAEICVALDGLPLALELAGAALKDFSPSELLERLEASLELLVGGPIDVPARQQTVRATIQWSYDLLAEAEQRLFERLAVFTGGWTEEAALAVCGATAESLRSLVEKALVRADGARFSMLVPIREFALERLAADGRDSLRRAHAAYFAQLASSAQARARRHGRDAAYLDTFAQDYENLRAALAFTGEEGQTESFARLAAAVGEYCYVRGPYAEARRWLETAFATPPDDPRLHALVARSLGMVCIEQGAYERAMTAHERAVSLFRSLGDAEMEARSLVNLGTGAIYLDDYDRAHELLLEGRERGRRLTDDRVRDHVEQLVLNALGFVAYLQGRLAEAEPWFEECLTICERIDDGEGRATATMNLGMTALGLGRLDDAEPRLRDALRLAEDLQRPQTAAICLLSLAAVAARRRRFVHSARLLGAVDAMFDEYGIELDPFERDIRDDAVARVEAGLGQEAAAEAFAGGRSHSRSDALAEAWYEEL
jgi:predicted ATPase/DNA-binding SARP family transcriptional activator